MTTDIIYTQVDEAPELASSSFLPIIKAFSGTAGVLIESKNISLAGRILAAFSDQLPQEQQQSDDLAWLGGWVHKPEANIIKLPNISASVAQLKAVIAELQEHGYAIPDYPEASKSDKEADIRSRYDSIKGSAVNPVLRQGNSDRRCAASVKEYARKHPHRMGAWSKDSKTNVAHMNQGDFYENETSATITDATAGNARIEFINSNKEAVTLKDGITLNCGDVIDSAAMSVGALRAFVAQSMERAKQEGVLFSLHLKATMMKVSDPIIFGQALMVFFAGVFTKHEVIFDELGINPNHGFGELLKKVSTLPQDQQDAINKDIEHAIEQGPELAMVDSDKGISNFHVPSDVIIDASMAASIRGGGKMWGTDGKEHDTLALIPDRCYAGIYQATIDFCRQNGAFDPTTMGSVANVGLMAQKAEEYGSHDKTFVAPAAGSIQIVSESGEILLTQTVATGDIYRSCTVKADPIEDWVKLSVSRGHLSNTPVVFWLDKQRAHDRELIRKVEAALKNIDTHGVEIKILAPYEAMLHTLKRSKAGKDTISATGNVLRDYLTDLFPILELGTSAKMLSIVPLANGGGLFETGAGGSAPKHVQQFIAEGHLRWDSLGEFLALSESLSHLARSKKNSKAQVLADALETATGTLLDLNQSPGRKAGQLSNNGSHFYEALHWAQALANQEADLELKKHFTPIAEQLQANTKLILEELGSMQGKSVDCGGYFQTDAKKVAKIMRSSPTLNAIIAAI